MTKLETLIQQLCPDGVEYKELGEIAPYPTSRIDASEVDANTYVGVDNLLPDKQGKTVSTCTPVTGRLIAFQSGDILIGNIRPYLKKIWLATHNGGTNGDVLTFHINDTERITPEFLYYILSSDSFFHYDMQFAKGAKMPRGDKAAILQYTVPVPPLEIQREIVRILDSYTARTAELQAQLTAEMAARKQQYEYYRDELLLNNPQSAPFYLGDIGTVAMCKRILKSETSTTGDIPFYKIGTFGRVADSYISRETFEKYKSAYSYPKKGDLLISAAGTIGRVVQFDGKPAYFQDSNIVWLDNDESRVLNRYLYYCYQLQPWQAATGGTISRLYNDNIRKAKIFVPPLVEQERIVAILDRFDALCNDLTSGMPAEIEARQKQYEYYRDKLLTFKEMK